MTPPPPLEKEHGTEGLADASFLEELLRGRRTLVLSLGDGVPGQHLRKRLGAQVALLEMITLGPIPRPDGSADAVVAIGTLPEPAGIARLLSEGRRLLAQGGILVLSWVDPTRASLESVPGPSLAVRPRLAAEEVSRRLAEQFNHCRVVARQPYLGFQYVSGGEAEGALTLDNSLLGGAPEAPTGFVALASDAPLPQSGDALIQVSYDRALARVAHWAQDSGPVQGATTGRGPSSPSRIREGSGDVERLRAEASALRDRSRAAVEEADRARGEARTANERVALLEAEVTKLRGRLKGAPDAESENLRLELATRTEERDRARSDAEGAAAEAARALEAAAQYEREVEFLNERVQALERELEQTREERESSARTLESHGSELATLRGQVEEERAALERATLEAQQRGESAAARVQEAEKRALDLQRRHEQSLKRLDEAQRRLSELEEAKSAAERAAEEAWKRVRDQPSQLVPPPQSEQSGGLVPAVDLAAVEASLAAAISRAETAEREQRLLLESAAASGGSGQADEVLAAREAELSEARAELSSVRELAVRDRERIRELEVETGRLDGELEGLRGGLGGEDRPSLEAIGRAALAQAEAARNHAEADALKEAVSLAEKEVARLNEEAETRSARERDRERRIAELEAQLIQQKGRGDSGDIERRAVAMSQRLAVMEAELERAKDDLKQAHAEARKYRALAEAIDPPTDRK